MIPVLRRARWPAVLVMATVLDGSCRRPPANAAASIEFTAVPEAAVGGSDRMATVSGRVRGAGAGHRVVLFAKGGVWWVQPLTAQPFTTIGKDATWTSRIHLGTEYAALLVDSSYQPPETTERLPPVGGSVLAVVTAKGAGDFTQRARKVVAFSGYDWEVRDTPSERGG